MSWASFWVGVAAIPALAIATGLVVLAAYWLLKLAVHLHGKTKAHYKLNPNGNREGIAAKILSTGGRSVYVDFGPMTVILQAGKPWLRGQEVWDLRHKLEALIREEKKEGGKYL